MSDLQCQSRSFVENAQQFLVERVDLFAQFINSQ
jgi:hypothetical protein